LVEQRLTDREAFMRRVMNEDDAEQAVAAKLVEENLEPPKLFSAQSPRRRRTGDRHRHGAGEADEGNVPASPDKGEIAMRAELRCIVRHERHPVGERLVPRYGDAG